MNSLERMKIGDCRDIWDVNISREDRLIRIVCNEDTEFHTFQHRTKHSTLLAATRAQGEVSLLYTVTCKQVSPICTSCVTRKCPHVHSYELDNERQEIQEFVSNFPSVAEDDTNPLHSDHQDRTDRSETTSEAGTSEGDAEDDDNLEEEGSAEQGKHKKYWVSNINVLMLLLLVKIRSKKLLTKVKNSKKHGITL